MTEIASLLESDVQSGQLVLDKSLMLRLDIEMDEYYERVRRRIISEAEKLPFWGEELPKMWIPFQHHIEVLRNEGRKIVSVDELCRVSEGFPVPLDKENVDLCLRFMHSLGQVIYFRSPGLQEYVILFPQWLIDALKSLITCGEFCTGEGKEKKEEANKGLAKNGMIRKAMIEEIWKQEEDSQFLQHKDHLLKVMEKLDLLATPRKYEKGKLLELDYYFIPSMVKEEAPERWLQDIIGNNSCVCTFDFSQYFLPSAVFFRLMSCCISTWPVINNRIYFGSCFLSLDPFHALLLLKEANEIKVVIVHRRRSSAITQNTVNNIVSIVNEMLKSIVSIYPRDERCSLFTVDKPDIKVFLLYLHIPLSIYNSKNSCGFHLT